MAQAILIRTPTDFEGTMQGDDFIKCSLVSPPEQLEASFRKSIDQIFDDLPYIDSSDNHLMSSYLRTIAQPLQDLKSIGFVVFAILSKGLMKPEGRETNSVWN